MRLERKYRDRLKKLFSFLEDLPQKKFYFGTWGRMNVSKGKRPRYEYLAVPPSLANCNTSGCVAGWLPELFPRDWTWKDGPVLRRELEEALKHYQDVTFDSFRINEQFSTFFGLHEDLGEPMVMPGETIIYSLPDDDDEIPIDLPVSPGNRCSPQDWVKFARKFLTKAGYENVP